MEECKKCGKLAEISVAEPKDNADVYSLCFDCLGKWFKTEDNFFKWI